ncbi:hypothetical protein U1701_05270 [Sphingomonas sp. PB2P19]
MTKTRDKRAALTFIKKAEASRQGREDHHRSLSCPGVSFHCACRR